jgi:hypothetical protein
LTIFGNAETQRSPMLKQYSSNYTWNHLAIEQILVLAIEPTLVLAKRFQDKNKNAKMPTTVMDHHT